MNVIRNTNMKNTDNKKEGNGLITATYSKNINE